MSDEMVVIMYVQIEGIGSFYKDMLHIHIQYSSVNLINSLAMILYEQTNPSHADIHAKRLIK